MISCSFSSGTLCYLVFFFFFKQKTAYEMRISDWSSDVCSSDLGFEGGGGFLEKIDDRACVPANQRGSPAAGRRHADNDGCRAGNVPIPSRAGAIRVARAAGRGTVPASSSERRVRHAQFARFAYVADALADGIGWDDHRYARRALGPVRPAPVSGRPADRSVGQEWIR